MEPRLDIQKLEPKAYTAMFGLESYLRQTQLTVTQRELIKIRASQINGCAYCIEIHAADARRNNETESRIYALSAWRESPLFTPEERSLLQLTDEVTLISNHGLSDAAYNNLKEYFDENTIAQAIMQVAAINAWNRIGVAARLMHEHQMVGFQTAHQ